MSSFLAGLLIAAVLGGGAAIALTYVQLETARISSTEHVRL